MLTAGLCQGPDIRTLNVTWYSYSQVTQIGTVWLLEDFPGAILWTDFAFIMFPAMEEQRLVL